MGYVFGAVFVAVGIAMLIRPRTVAEYIAKRSIGKQDPVSDAVIRLLGVVFVPVGVLALSGNWPPG